MNSRSLDLRLSLLGLRKEVVIGKVIAEGRYASKDGIWLVKYGSGDALYDIHGQQISITTTVIQTPRITIKRDNQQQFFYFTYLPPFVYFFCSFEPRISLLSAPSGFPAAFEPALTIGLSFSPVTRSTFFGGYTCVTVVSNSLPRNSSSQVSENSFSRFSPLLAETSIKADPCCANF